MKRLRKKRCKFCYQWFTPHPQTPHQDCCSNPACRKKRKALAAKNWWLHNPKYAQSRKPKLKAWAKDYPDYWRKYRKEHPDYVASDGRRRCSSYRRRRISAKQDTVHKISVEKLESIRDLEPVSAAKQDAVHRRVDGILDYLFWKECSAKQDSIADCLSGAP